MEAGSVAAQGGLNEGDVIVAIDGPSRAYTHNGGVPILTMEAVLSTMIQSNPALVGQINFTINSQFEYAPGRCIKGI